MQFNSDKIWRHIFTWVIWGHSGTFEGNRRITLIVVIMRDGGKSGDHPGTNDDPTTCQLSRLVAPSRNPEVNPSSTQSLILSPGLTSVEVTSQAMMTQLHLDSEVIQRPGRSHKDGTSVDGDTSHLHL